jgi:sec-independent protein translocase protein TatA
MGLGGISVWQLLIILAIVVLVFGTKRLKTLGGDLGGALKSFRKAMDQSDDDKSSDTTAEETKKIESGEKPDAEFAEQSRSQEQK